MIILSILMREGKENSQHSLLSHCPGTEHLKINTVGYGISLKNRYLDICTGKDAKSSIYS